MPNCQKCAADFAVVQVKSVPLLWKQFTFKKSQEKEEAQRVADKLSKILLLRQRKR